MKLLTMKKLIEEAYNYHYAVPAINVNNMETINGLFQIAENMKSPIIIQIAPMQLTSQNITYDYIVKLIKLTADRYKGKYAIHLDHGTNINELIEAEKAGFTSLMYDGSSLPFHENIKKTKEARNISHRVTLEGELGVLNAENGSNEEETENKCYTDPKLARVFLEETNVDCLAVSIGNAHGFYKNIPNLNFQVLDDLHNEINIPLVLHGASGLSQKDIRSAIKLGVSKINFFTSVDYAFTLGLMNSINNEKSKMMNYMENGRQEMMKEISNIIKMCNSEDKL